MSTSSIIHCNFRICELFGIDQPNQKTEIEDKEEQSKQLALEYKEITAFGKTLADYYEFLVIKVSSNNPNRVPYIKSFLK